MESILFGRVVEEERYRAFGDLSKPAAGQIWAINDRVTYPDGHVEVLASDPARPVLVVLMQCEPGFGENSQSVAQVFPLGNHWILASPHGLVFNPQASP